MFFFMQLLLSLRHYQYKKKFVFFHLATLITTLSSREKKVFFTFMYCDHYGKIKREKKFFFELATTITTPWSREKKLFLIYPFCPLMKKEKCCFSFIHYHQYAMTKTESYFFHLATAITTLWSREKKVFFSFTYYDHYAMIKREKCFFI